MTTQAIAKPGTLDEIFKDAMAALAAGVCVVCTVDGHGRPWGFTATSVTSVSMAPPLLLVCLARAARSHPVFSSCRTFGVSLLAEDQHAMASRFASRVPDRFAGSGFVCSPAGVPVHPEAVGWIECRRTATIDGGDHSVLLARVTSASSRGGRPLIYHQRDYARLVS